MAKCLSCVLLADKLCKVAWRPALGLADRGGPNLGDHRHVHSRASTTIVDFGRPLRGEDTCTLFGNMRDGHGVVFRTCSSGPP
jgi:hypothetical protein